MNYNELSQTIQDYLETTESLFVSSIPTFVQQAEERIYNSVQIPALRKSVTGTATTSNQYLACPDDFLSVFSMAAIRSTGDYEYLLNKDVNFIRAAYPNPTTDVGIPRYYALFGSQYANKNELSFILGPTPDDNYSVELHYFYYPPTIVQGTIKTVGTITGGSAYTNGIYLGVPLSSTGQGMDATADIVVSGNQVTSVTIKNSGQLYVVGDSLTCANSYIGNTGTGFSVPVATVDNATGTSWLGDNYSPALLYGAIREGAIFQKAEQDMVAYYEQKFQEALAQLARLGDGLERGDAYRDGQARIKVVT